MFTVFQAKRGSAGETGDENGAFAGDFVGIFSIDRICNGKFRLLPLARIC
ncbi:MAG: hypothetical protein JWO30_513 [Fibrobacteres bacterium]|nr:hypothetical protein [Fibrobacterota bacterium]